MTISIETIASLLGTASLGVAGWLWREISFLRGELAKQRTHVAEHYVTKDDNKDSLDRVYASLERIERKLDSR